MEKEFKVYTKTGDDGTTGLVGGSRVKKYDPRLEAYGTVDELNAVLGLIRSTKLEEDVIDTLVFIQNKLFNIGSRLASDDRGEEFTKSLEIKDIDTEKLEKKIDKYELSLPPLKEFVLPGGDLSSAQCHVARTICRRAERRILEFAESNHVSPETIRFINRLSDFLFVLSRKLSSDRNAPETKWSKD